MLVFVVDLCAVQDKLLTPFISCRCIWNFLFWVRGNFPEFDLGFSAVGKRKTVERKHLAFHFAVPDVCFRVQCSSQTKQLKEETVTCAVVVVMSFNVVCLHQGSRFRKIFVSRGRVAIYDVSHGLGWTGISCRSNRASDNG